MITNNQLTLLARKFKTNETTIFREYLQLVFLSRLYQLPDSRRVFFKGGTAIHLLLQAPRFSEDLDFTVELSEPGFTKLTSTLFPALTKQEEFNVKPRKTIAGKRFMLSAKLPFSNHQAYVNLDFSFREKVLRSEKSVILTELPVIINSYIYHLSPNELLAEKIRAILHRRQGRDLYDLWYLLSQKAVFEPQLVAEKLNYYRQKFNAAEFIAKIDSFPPGNFVRDLRPFVPLGQREKLPALLKYIKDFIPAKLKTA